MERSISYGPVGSRSIRGVRCISNGPGEERCLKIIICTWWICRALALQRCIGAKRPSSAAVRAVGGYQAAGSLGGEEGEEGEEGEGEWGRWM